MYLVVFRNRKRIGIDRAAYDRQANRMEELAKAQPGYLSFKGYVADDGEGVAISEWQDEAAARAWGRDAEHLLAQSMGQKAWYAEYTLFACNDPHIRRFVARDAG